jgi:hypothetical protein
MGEEERKGRENMIVLVAYLRGLWGGGRGKENVRE